MLGDARTLRSVAAFSLFEFWTTDAMAVKCFAAVFRHRWLTKVQAISSPYDQASVIDE